MKHQLHLITSEHQVILASVRAYKKSMELDHKNETAKLIDISYNKLIYSMKPMLDGMEMIIIVKALRRRSNLFLLLRKQAERDVYLELSNKIDLERQKFQEVNNPLKNRKTASAGTLTA